MNFNPASAGRHIVSDFRADVGPSPSDTANLDDEYGDTLIIAARQFQYKTLAARNLTDGVGNNGRAGSLAISSASGPGAFKVAYVAWTQDHNPSPGIAANPTPADIIMRSVAIDQGAVTVDPVGTPIAGSENKVDPFNPRKFYGGGQQQQPAPTYLAFMAEGGNYAAYWSALYPAGPIRRTTHLQAGISDFRNRGTYVIETPPNVPVVAQGYGELGAAAIPGSGATRTVVAFEDTIGGVNNQVHVRWEDIGAGTSTGVRFVRPVIPEDFSVAVDSAGAALVLWRENANLYAVGYDAARTQVMAPTLITASAYLRDAGIDHYYRPYHAVSTVNGSFAVAYGRNGGAFGAPIYLRIVTLPATVGGETLVNAGNTGRFPTLAMNRRHVLVAFYADSIYGALYSKQGAGIDAASKQVLTLSTEMPTFNTVGSGWYIYHSYKAPGVSMDSKGNIATAYDNEFHSKLAFVGNTAIYYDSAGFTSRVRSATNPVVTTAYDPAIDSLQFLSMRLVTAQPSGQTARYNREIAVSMAGTFTDPGSGFVPYADNVKTAAGTFRYRITLKANPPDNITQTKIDSLILTYNVKPRVPRIDSIRIGQGTMAAYDPSAAYSALPRKDSIRLVVSGLDIDDDGLQIRAGLGAGVSGSAAAVRKTPGNFGASFAFMPPDTALSPLPLSLTSADPQGWISVPFPLSLDYRNRAPAETVAVVRRRGLDSLGVFKPASGPRDTIAPAADQVIPLQVGDVATVQVRLADLNDDTVSVRWRRNGVQAGLQRAAVKDTLPLSFAPDTLPPLIDTVHVVAFDKNDSVVTRLLIRPNRAPRTDSLWLASYSAGGGAVRPPPYDRIRNFSADSGLVVPADLPSVLKGAASDPDQPEGDRARLAWSVLRRKTPCPPGPACHDTTSLGSGDSLSHTFTAEEEYLLLRAIDSTGAFVQRRVRLEYPVLDTAGSAAFATGLKALSEDMDFILQGRVRSRTVDMEVISQGNIPLQITSIATARDDRKWLGLTVTWEDSTTPGADSVSLAGSTAENPLTAPIDVAPGKRLGFRFRFTSDSLRGDSTLTDTLLVQTNDFANPVLRIPFTVVYNDLPVLRISHVGGEPGPAGGLNDRGLPPLLPVRSSLVFAFSEAVRVPDPAALIRIYSRLDSLKNPGGYRPIEGAFAYRRRALPRRGAASAQAGAQTGADIADTLVFTPAYTRASDSLRVRPRPGAFIHRDVLHIRVSNGITDRAGNSLDLRLDRDAAASGSVDTIFEARVDTGYVRVVSTVPAAGSSGWDPDDALRIRFNSALLRRPALPGNPATDTLTLLNLAALRGDSNHGVWVTSVDRGARRYDFRSLTLEDGDSTLVIATRPRFPAFDTVTVRLSGGITDINGLSLDGNADGFPGWIYDSADTSDAFAFSFVSRGEDFYVFPNPFRHQDPRHREKGSITFKNINTLRGFKGGREVVLRVHTMTGDLVYNSRTRPFAAQANRSAWTSIDWDLANNAGNKVGTGVYIYTLIMGESAVLKKGKVAVIR